MTFEAFRDEVFKQAKSMGFDDYELYYSTDKNFSVRVFQGEISQYTNAISEGVGFRGTFEGKMGYAYSENLDSGIIAQLLENAKANAGIIEEKEVEKLYPGDKNYPEANAYSPAMDDVEAAQKIEWVLALEKEVLDLDPRIKIADICTIFNTEVSVAIANSYGLDVSQKRNMAGSYVVARAEEGGALKSSLEFWVGRDFTDFDYKKIAKPAVDMAISSLGASSIPSGEYPAVLAWDVTASLLRAFTKVFIAEDCQKGFSLLNKDKIGTVIAADIVTIRDDGITDLSVISSAFDAEGVATENKAVIENGVLKTLLYNTKSAAKDGVKSTGNASKQGVGGGISSASTNFYLVPGEASLDGLLSGAENGVYITDLAGIHSGTNPISGDFSLSADGFLIENGKISRPVEQITIAGNFYEMLKDIKAVGSDFRFSYMGAVVGAPSISLGSLSIAGL